MVSDGTRASGPAPSLYARTIGQVRRQGLPLLLFSLFANLLLLVSSIYMLQVFDRVLTSGSLETLLWLTVIALTATAVYAVLEVARRSLLTRVGAWLESELSEPVLRRNFDLRVRNVTPPASLAEVRDLAEFVRGDQILAFFDAPWMPVFIAVIWLLDPMLGMIALGGAVALFLCAIANDRLTRHGQQQAAASTRQGLVASQRMLDHADAVVGLGMTEPLIKRWSRQQDAARTDGTRMTDVTSAVVNASRFLRLSLQVVILGAGAYLVVQGSLTPGGMIAASILLGRALSPVERSISAWRGLIGAREANERLTALFKDVPEAEETVALPPATGHLAVSQARYLVPGSREPILRQVNFALEPGQVCGIIGPSGAGKSCLCRLIVGAWAPHAGSVRLDGAEVSQWPAEDRGRQIGYLPQQVEFFPGTVAQNIARMQEVDSQAVVTTAQLAGVHQLILRLPKGYETDVGLHGAKLSGGQRQRIALARALYGDPKLLVLDEPNSNLDSEGELALFKAINTLKAQDKTILIVAHHPTALRAADKVLWLQDGVSAHFGDRDEVLQKLSAGRRVVTMSASGLNSGQTNGQTNAGE